MEKGATAAAISRREFLQERFISLVTFSHKMSITAEGFGGHLLEVIAVAPFVAF